mgnify:CR=1 FL=1
MPLGGLGEFGLNAMVLEWRGEILLLDAGMLFPPAEMPGVDSIVPDFDYLAERKDRVHGILLTHGHEDHIGALSHALQASPAPVYGSRLTLGFARKRLQERGVSADLRVLSPGQPAQVGPFRVHPIRVAHSVLDSLALAIETPAGTVLASGDFKIDASAPPEERTDLEALTQWGDRGVLALLSDSTNVEQPGTTGGEDEVLEHVDVVPVDDLPVDADGDGRFELVHTDDAFAEAFACAGFREEAFYPCYGLAEATLLVSGSDGPRRPLVKRVDRGALSEHRVVEVENDQEQAVQALVGCGTTWLGQEVAIVDTETHRRLPERQVGEIWVRGLSVAKGYWNRPEDTRLDFLATIAGEEPKTLLRTGDLGFVSDGELFVTGREKEMIIVRGRNLYPHDIELSVGHSHPALTTGAGASFSVDVDGEERLVVVYEVDRQYRNGDLADVIRGARRAIVDDHELDPHAVVLIRMASLPRTTSGKVQRNLCRQQFLDGSLNVVAQWTNDLPVEIRIFGDPEGLFHLYNDDGKTFNFEKGQFSLQKIEIKDGKISVKQENNADFGYTELLLKIMSNHPK